MAIDFPSSPTVGQIYTFAGVTYTFTAQGVWATAGAIGIVAATAGVQPPQGRLTIDIVPVPTVTVSGATGIRYMPYVGDMVPIFNGTSWLMMSTGGNLTNTTTDTALSPAVIGPNKINDWYVWNNFGSTLQVSHGPDWTNDTTRSAGAALVRVNGIWLNSVSITNGPAAQRGTYVGTTRSNASSQLDWILGGLGSGGIAGLFNVWNCYNRVTVSTVVMESSDSWAYVSPIWRPASAGSTNMRVSFVSGLQEDAFGASYQCLAIGSGGAGAIGIGYDVTNAYSGMAGSTNNTSGVAALLRGEFTTTSLGYHFMQAIEYATTSTVNFYGDGAFPAYYQNGLIFTGRM